MLKLASLLLLVFPLGAFAGEVFPVQVNAGAYARDYQIGTVRTSGTQTFELAPGAYTLSNLTAQFSFNVDASGNVTSSAPASATASGNVLTLNTVSLTIDPQNYSRWYKPNGGAEASGLQQIASIVGLDDSILSPSMTTIAEFNAAADGTITLVDSPADVSVSNSQITFGNVTFTINPGAFNRLYNPMGGAWAGGVRDLVGIPGMTETVYNDLPSVIATYQVSSSGRITVFTGSGSVAVSNGELSFETVTLSVDPQSYPRLYAPVGDTQRSGPSQFVAIPGVLDRITNLEFADIVDFTADSQGAITISAGAAGVTAENSELVFGNVAVNVTPVGYTGNYQFFSGGSQSGEQVAELIPGVQEYFSVAGGTNHAVVASETGVSVDGELATPATLSLNSAASIVFSIVPQVNGRPQTTSTAESSAGNSQGEDLVTSGGGCAPSAHAGEPGSVTGAASPLWDLFSSPFGFAIFFLIWRMKRKLGLRS